MRTPQRQDNFGPSFNELNRRLNTSDTINPLPRGTVGYAQVTGGQAGITAEVNLTGLTVTVTLSDLRRYRISWGLIVTDTVGGDVIALQCYDGASVIGQGWQIIHSAGPNQSMYGSCVRLIAAGSGGSHTIKLTLQRNAGTGTVSMQAAANTPAYILVEDIGT